METYYFKINLAALTSVIIGMIQAQLLARGSCQFYQSTGDDAMWNKGETFVASLKP